MTAADRKRTQRHREALGLTVVRVLVPAEQEPVIRAHAAAMVADRRAKALAGVYGEQARALWADAGDDG